MVAGPVCSRTLPLGSMAMSCEVNGQGASHSTSPFALRMIAWPLSWASRRCETSCAEARIPLHSVSAPAMAATERHFIIRKLPFGSGNDLLNRFGVFDADEFLVQAAIKVGEAI